MIEQYYIIRTDRAGVFFAQIAERRGSEADLVNARRIYYWTGATECIGLAVDGTSNPSQCRITVAAPSMTVLGVIEVHPVSEKALNILQSVKAWTA